MTFLPAPSERLGALSLDSVFMYYEGPVLFSARDELNRAYLAVEADEDVYLYVPVSEQRLMAVRTGLVSIRVAFSEPESAAVFVASRGALREMPASEISPDWLPDDDVFLAESLETAFAFTPELLGDLSRRQGRPLAALEFDLPGRRRTEFPLGKAGELMTQFQSYVEAVGMEETELDLVQLAAASFAIIVAPRSDQPRLFPMASQAIEQATQVLRRASTPDDQVESLGQLSRSVRVQLRNFLAACEDSQTGVTVFNASPSGEVRTTAVPYPAVRASLDAIRARSELPSETFEINGHLIAIHHITGTFGVIEDRATGKRKKPRSFKGRVDADLLPRLRILATGRGVTYRFTIRRDRDAPEFAEDKPSKHDTLVDLVELREQMTTPDAAPTP